MNKLMQIFKICVQKKQEQNSGLGKQPSVFLKGTYIFVYAGALSGREDRN